MTLKESGVNMVQSNVNHVMSQEDVCLFIQRFYYITQWTRPLPRLRRPGFSLQPGAIQFQGHSIFSLPCSVWFKLFLYLSEQLHEEQLDGEQDELLLYGADGHLHLRQLPGRQPRRLEQTGRHRHCAIANTHRVGGRKTLCKNVPGGFVNAGVFFVKVFVFFFFSNFSGFWNPTQVEMESLKILLLIFKIFKCPIEASSPMINLHCIKKKHISSHPNAQTSIGK